MWQKWSLTKIAATGACATSVIYEFLLTCSWFLHSHCLWSILIRTHNWELLACICCGIFFFFFFFFFGGGGQQIYWNNTIPEDWRVLVAEELACALCILPLAMSVYQFFDLNRPDVLIKQIQDALAILSSIWWHVCDPQIHYPTLQSDVLPACCQLPHMRSNYCRPADWEAESCWDLCLPDILSVVARAACLWTGYFVHQAWTALLLLLLRHWQTDTSSSHWSRLPGSVEQDKHQTDTLQKRRRGCRTPSQFQQLRSRWSRCQQTPSPMGNLDVRYQIFLCLP